MLKNLRLNFSIQSNKDFHFRATPVIQVAAEDNYNYTKSYTASLAAISICKVARISKQNMKENKKNKNKNCRKNVNMNTPSDGKF